MAIAVFFAIWMYAFSPGPGPGKQTVVVDIPTNTGVAEIQQLLAAKGIIDDDLRFGLLAQLMRVAHRLKAGEYELTTGQFPYQILQVLEKGQVLIRTVTIPEGSNLDQIADLLAAASLISREEFQGLVRDPDFIKELGLAVESLEGYLFPDTYRFVRGQEAKNIIKTMVDRLGRIYTKVADGENGKSGLSLHEILTLASIVEKETGLPEERPLIARVFLNRLEQGMRLQTDPTVIYGLERFDGRLSYNDLKNQSPYNTYIIKGLPPGPIGNPGQAAIEAVLNPAEESYLYFVSKNDGTHCFSRTLTEHNQAVEKYQKNHNH